MFSKSKNVSQLILMLTFAMLLPTLIFAMLPEPGSTQQEKERAVQIKTFRDQPVEIVSVKVKGAPIEPKRKFTGDSDWLNGMTVTLKNVYDKPVVFATVLVIAYYEKDGARIQNNGKDVGGGIELMFGMRPPFPGEPPHPYTAPLMPGHTADVVLSEWERDQLYHLINDRNASTDVTELTVQLHKVFFEGDNDRSWMSGFMRRRDPDNPNNWIVVEPETPRNHAARKPKNGSARPTITNLAPVLYDPLDPPCTFRDAGTESKFCKATDTGGNFCVRDNKKLVTTGSKNLIAGNEIDQICGGSIPAYHCTAYESYKDDLGDPTCTPPVSPIILDIAGNGFDLTDNAGGVRFDLNGNGIAESLS